MLGLTKSWYRNYSGVIKEFGGSQDLSIFKTKELYRSGYNLTSNVTHTGTKGSTGAVLFDIGNESDYDPVNYVYYLHIWGTLSSNNNGLVGLSHRDVNYTETGYLYECYSVRSNESNTFNIAKYDFMAQVQPRLCGANTRVDALNRNAYINVNYSYEVYRYTV